MTTFEEAFEKWAADRHIAFDDDRTATIGGSEIGGCARQVGYKKSSTPQDEGYVETGGFAARGNVMEDNVLVPVVRNWVEAHGGKLLWAGQADQMRLVNDAKRVSVTPDGLAINMPRDCLKDFGVADIGSHDLYVELKSIDPRVNAGKLPKDAHVDQVNLGIGLVRETAFDDGSGDDAGVVEYDPRYGIIVYIDASDYSTIHVHPVQFDQDGFAGQLERAAWIMDAAKAGTRHVETLRPEGKIAGGNDCRYCAFSKRCLGYAAMVPRVTTIPDKKAVARIKRTASAFKKLEAKEDDAKAKAAKVEADLKEMLAAANTKYLEVEGYKLDWNVTPGQERFDADAAKKALVAAGHDLKDFVKTTKPSERLSVKKIAALAT